MRGALEGILENKLKREHKIYEKKMEMKIYKSTIQYFGDEKKKSQPKKEMKDFI